MLNGIRQPAAKELDKPNAFLGLEKVEVNGQAAFGVNSATAFVMLFQRPLLCSECRSL